MSNQKTLAEKFQRLPIPKKFKDFIPIALEASKSINDPNAIRELLQKSNVDIAKIDSMLGYLNMPIVGSAIKKSAKSMGIDIEAVIRDIKGCLEPKQNRYERRHPTTNNNNNKYNKYSNIKYTR